MIVLCSNEAALGHYAGGMRQRLDAGYGIGFKRNQVGRKAFANRTCFACQAKAGGGLSRADANGFPRAQAAAA